MLQSIQSLTRPANGRLTPLLLSLSTLWMWLSFWALYHHLTLLGILAESPKWRTFTWLAGLGVLLVSLLVFILIASWERVWRRVQTVRFTLPPAFCWALAAALLAVFPLILYGRFSHIVQNIVIHLFLLWVFSWMMFALLRPSFPARTSIWTWSLSVSGLSLAVLFARYLPSISSSPFTTAWSEGGVLFYASLFFSKTRYGVEAGLPVINPGRALMQSILFAVPDVPLILHRVWDVFLWFALPVLVILAAGRRFRILKHRFFPVFLLWSLLFFFQGPVYYHLLVVPLIVLLGFRSDRFWRSLLVVAAAALWGGLTRINWFPMAGLLAVTLYLLENPQQPLRRAAVYTSAWFLSGFAAAFLTSRLYLQLSGTPAGYFENPFQTPLLWDRLLPSATNPWGALIAGLVFTLPVLVYLASSFWSSPRIHWFRRLGIAAILLVLFLGGLLVSVRIGGGNNLHNLDAYLVMLWLCGSALFFAKVPVDAESPPPPQPVRWLEALIFLLPVLVPLIFFRNTWPGPRDPAAWSDGLRAFRSQVEADLAAGRSVLISEQPQLIPFGFWESPPAFPEFEKIFMFEAAITQNRAYLTDLYHALEEQRFDRIVTEPLYLKYQGKTAAFGEENDAWVYWIAEPLMCFYEPVQTWNSIGVQYLAPRTPDPSCDLDQRLAALP